jgi:uncharacterized membrane protein (UPF0127 family)
MDRLPGVLVPLLLMTWASGAQALTASDGRVLEDVFRQSTLSFDNNRALACPILQIYLAESPSQKARGLMFVRALPADWGMLFVYARPRPISMWMKNTFIPLDMVFIDAEGTVVDVAANTEPGSLKSITAKAPAVAVLEINAGLAARLGIGPGSRARHEAFRRRNAAR